MSAQTLVFREVQRFRQRWLWLVVLAVVAAGVGVGARVWLARPPAPTHERTLALVGMLIGVAVLWLFVGARLITEVRRDGLYVRFRPFHRDFRRVDLAQVVDLRATTYRPLMEYGGWGIRWTLRGRAYNVSGNRGVRLEFRSGRHLLIGSQRPEELARAIGTLADMAGQL